MNMKISRVRNAICLAILVGLSLDASAQNSNSFNRVSVGYRPGFNIRAKFSGLGGFRPTNPGRAVGGIDHTYLDGYNRVDARDNYNSSTWNWGYDNASQLSGNDTVVMHSADMSSSAQTESRTDDPQQGFQVMFSRQLGRIHSAPWGIQAGFNYTDVQIKNSSRLAAPYSLISDAYSLEGVTPPGAPYSGNFNGPAVVIGDTPTRSISSGVGAISGLRQIDAQLYGFKIGPCLDVPISRKFSLDLAAGLAVVVVDNEFTVSDSVSIPRFGAWNYHARGTGSDALVGGYVSLALSYNISSMVSVFAGGEFQNVGNFRQSSGGRSVDLNLGESAFVNAGVALSF